MKHNWAVIDDDTNQVLFHISGDLAFKHKRQITMRYREDLTLKDLSKKYAVEFEYKELPNYEGYFGFFVKRSPI